MDARESAAGGRFESASAEVFAQLPQNLWYNPITNRTIYQWNTGFVAAISFQTFMINANPHAFMFDAVIPYKNPLGEEIAVGDHPSFRRDWLGAVKL